MGAPAGGMFLLVAGAIIGVGYLIKTIYDRSKEDDSQQAQENNRWYNDEVSRRSDRNIHHRTLSGRNNHDHLKHRHSSREDAEREIRRMQGSGRYSDTETLRSYYNEDYDAWLVGNRRW
eukprot:6524536-Ditylum_brightwellii.AAC.1